MGAEKEDMKFKLYKNLKCRELIETLLLIPKEDILKELSSDYIITHKKFC